MPSLLARPPYDKELKSSLDAMNLKPNTHITPTDIPSLRLQHTPDMSYIQSLLEEYGIEHEERIIDGPGGDLVLSIFRSRTKTTSALSPPGGAGGGGGQGGRPGIYFTHGGGMISGTRFMGIELALDWVHHLDAICISPEYRLAPEHPHPAPIEDCYAGLVYTFAHAVDLGIDAKKMVTAGLSAGGGLAAGLALMCRDRGRDGDKGLRLCAQLLICPMLDDRVDTVSSRQYVDEGVWCRGSNITGWSSLLGSRRGTEGVSIYAAPARAAASPSKLSPGLPPTSLSGLPPTSPASLPPTSLSGLPPTSPAGLPPTSLSGLPPTFIDVGEAEVFRDECVSYASHLWASGVQTELHVWPGAWHAFDLFAPGARVSVVARETRRGWLERTLASL